MSVDVKAFDMRTADDLSGLEAALAAAGADGIRRLALLMRVAGEYTDGSREKARGAIPHCWPAENLSDKTQYVTVIGAEGASTPCGYAFIDSGNTGSRNGPAAPRTRYCARGFSAGGDDRNSRVCRRQ